MKKITESEYQVALENGLLYDGEHKRPNLNKRVERAGYRTFKRTRHGIYVSEGRDGIYESILYYMEKDADKRGR